MEKDINYIELNKISWNNKTNIHLESDFYDQESFLKGNTSLKDIELALLGGIKGKSVLHLQCHFGQDSISMSRMGAEVTGVDLSDSAIELGRKIAIETGNSTSFICCDLYDLPKHLDKKFDIVFTSYGTITWLPDLDKWGKLISQFLKPKGQFIFVEFHPVVWMFDEHFTKIEQRYFNSGPIKEIETGTYADKGSDYTAEYILWNHGIGEVINSLINNGISIQSFDEYDYSPYDCFSETEEYESGKYRIKHLKNKIPMVYSLVGKKE